MWNKVADVYGYFSLLPGGLTFDPTDGWKDLPILDDTNPPPVSPRAYTWQSHRYDPCLGI